jgi:hypothetical protein
MLALIYVSAFMLKRYSMQAFILSSAGLLLQTQLILAQLNSALSSSPEVYASNDGT